MKDLACWMPGKRRVLLTSQRVSRLREVKVRRFMADALLSCSGYVQMNAAPGSYICRGSFAGMGSNLTLPCPRGLLGEQSWLCWSSPCPCCLTLEAVLRSKALMHVVTVVSKGEEVSRGVSGSVGKALLLVGAVALNGNVCANNWGR